MPSEAVLALIALLVGAGVFLALRHYFRHRQTVDSRYKALIDQTNDGIVIVEADGYQIQYCNPAFLNKVGYTHDEAAALALTDIFGDGEAAPDSVLTRLQHADGQPALNLQLRCKGGAQIDVEVRCNRLETDGRDGFAYVTHDVSVRRKAEQQLIDNQQRLDRMAHHDQLTGLPNRHYLATFLPQAIDEARAANQMLGVVFLDLDRFKHINDTRGHETGDKLLQEVAQRLKACVRESDVVIRMGGDEFVVVFRNVKSYDEVTNGAKRINDCLNKSIIIDQHALQTTGSVGVSLFPRDGTDMGELLKHSDTAMYQAKDRGRNNVQMFSQIMNRKLKLRVAMEASLRDALRLKQLDVHYQPFVNLLTRKVVGLEALIRWRHPVHGMVPADQFIPIAEETGLIVPMGNFVLHRTLQTMSAWQRQGVKLVPVSLNVAPAQLQRGDLQATISTLLATHGLRAELLQLEMTERAVFDANQAKSGETRQDTMVRLRDLGIKIAIDDFGTGYSSLSYLKNWRVDALKIDRSFVRDLVTDSSDLAIVSAIIAIARHLRIQVIAEGIEGYQQAEILRKLGCTIGQGFLFARPMPADQCLRAARKQCAGSGRGGGHARGVRRRARLNSARAASARTARCARSAPDARVTAMRPTGTRALSARQLLDANRLYYDSLWSGAQLVEPERFNTWPLVQTLLASRRPSPRGGAGSASAAAARGYAVRRRERPGARQAGAARGLGGRRFDHLVAFRRRGVRSGVRARHRRACRR